MTPREVRESPHSWWLRCSPNHIFEPEEAISVIGRKRIIKGGCSVSPTMVQNVRRGTADCIRAIVASGIAWLKGSFGGLNQVQTESISKGALTLKHIGTSKSGVEVTWSSQQNAPGIAAVVVANPDPGTWTLCMQPQWLFDVELIFTIME